MSYVGNVKRGGTTHLVGSTLFGTCSTAAGTAAKVGTLSNFDQLLSGVTVHLKMANSNTVANPTLNINGTGAKPITKYGTTTVGTSATTSWYAGSVVSFTYDGTSWVINDYKEDTSGSNVTGVKGNFESSYRTGNVNLTTANVAYIGTNATGGTVNDTMTWWRSKGTCYAWFNQLGQVNGQPAQWGFISSYVNEASEINQIWRGQDLKVYIRKANGSTTDMPTWTPIDTDTRYSAGTNITLSGTTFSVKDSPAFTGTPTTPTAGASTNNTQIASTAFVQAAINAKLPSSTTIYFNGGSKSIPNNAETAISLGTINKTGLLIGRLFVSWEGVSGGYRYAYPTVGTTNSTGLRWTAAGNQTQHMTITVVQNVTSGNTITAKVMQNSGGAVNVTACTFAGAVFG